MDDKRMVSKHHRVIIIHRSKPHNSIIHSRYRYRYFVGVGDREASKIDTHHAFRDPPAQRRKQIMHKQ